MILYFTRGFDFALEGQRRGEWVQDRFYEPDVPLVEIASTTVGIIGFGGIGYEIGRRAAALGARVLGLVRSHGPERVAELRAPGSEAVIGTAEPMPITYRLPVASAQVKSAILLAGLMLNLSFKPSLLRPITSPAATGWEKMALDTMSKWCITVLNMVICSLSQKRMIFFTEA